MDPESKQSRASSPPVSLSPCLRPCLRPCLLPASLAPHHQSSSTTDRSCSSSGDPRLLSSSFASSLASLIYPATAFAATDTDAVRVTSMTEVCHRQPRLLYWRRGAQESGIGIQLLLVKDDVDQESRARGEGLVRKKREAITKARKVGNQDGKRCSGVPFADY